MKIQECIKYAVEQLNKNNIENSILKARMLLSKIINKDKEYLIIHSDEELNSRQQKDFMSKLDLLKSGMPIQYLTNNQEFMKLNFYVDKNVLIPRADTEILVEEVISICKNINKKEISILDLCTGSGAIGISLACHIKNIKVYMTDKSKNALEIASKNIIYNNVSDKCELLYSNMFNNIKNKFDIIVSNPPYIKSEVINELSSEVGKEPLMALDGGKDGLDFYKIIVQEAFKYLNKDGYLALEIGYDQKEKVINLLEKEDKYKEIYSKKDLYNNDRIIICKLK